MLPTMVRGQREFLILDALNSYFSIFEALWKTYQKPAPFNIWMFLIFN